MLLIDSPHHYRSILLAESKGVRTRDVLGKWFDTHRPLVGVEKYVAWADTREVRAALDGRMEAELATVAAQHRASVWRALQDGWQSGEYDRVLAEAVPAYANVIRRYLGNVQSAVDQWTIDEAQRQAQDPDMVGPTAPGRSAQLSNEANRLGAQLNNRIEDYVEVAARDIAQRVQRDVSNAYRDGANERSWASKITVASLAKPALSAGQLVESEGRVVAAAQLVQSGRAESMGLRPAQVVRTDVNDRRRCDHCKKLAGTTYDLPAQQREFERMPLPDPGCYGGILYCRCGWLIRWVRS